MSMVQLGEKLQGGRRFGKRMARAGTATELPLFLGPGKGDGNFEGSGLGGTDAATRIPQT